MTTRTISYALQLTAQLDPNARRAFGQLDTELQQVEQQLRRSRDETRRLTVQQQQVGESSAEYDQLARGIRRAERDTERLTREQRRLQNELQQSAERIRRLRTVAGTGLAALAGLAAGVTAEVRSSGQEYARLLQVAESTGLQLGEIERLQRQARVQGFELDALAFREFANRIGETQAEVARVIAEGEDPFVQGIGAAGEALRDLGFDVQTVTNQDLPAIIAALQGTSRSLREFYGQEIFGGGEFEALAAALDVPPEILDRLDRIPPTTRETAEAMRLANADMEATLQSMRQLSGEAAVAFAPAFDAAAGALELVVTPLSAIARENPAVIQAMAAGVAGLTALTGAIWLLNTALAVRAALSGPVGWAALGVAATVGLGVGVGGFLATRQDDPEEEADRWAERELGIVEDQRRRADRETIMQAAYAGTREGVLEGSAQQEQTLRNILPVCPNEELIGAVGDLVSTLEADRAQRTQPSPVANPEFAPSETTGLTPQEQIRLDRASVIEGRVQFENELSRIANVNFQQAQLRTAPESPSVEALAILSQQQRQAELESTYPDLYQEQVTSRGVDTSGSAPTALPLPVLPRDDAGGILPAGLSPEMTSTVDRAETQPQATASVSSLTPPPGTMAAEQPRGLFSFESLVVEPLRGLAGLFGGGDDRQASVITDQRTSVQIDAINVMTQPGTEADDVVAELRGALDTARLRAGGTP